MARYFHGQIVEAMMSNGKITEPHPALIIDGESDFEVTGQLLVIPISSKMTEPCPDYHIKVHDNNTLHPNMKLTKPSWAKCNWAHWLEIRRVLKSRGYMPDIIYNPVIECYNRICDDPDFDDWVLQ